MATVNWQPTDEHGMCPVSGTKGKKVDTVTVKCLLDVSLREVQDTQYYFCRDEDCPVVYFATDGRKIFRLDDLRERVFQKEPDRNDVLVCYCFRYSVGDIRTAAENTESDRIIDDINAGIQAGQCACDWRNPQGDCCLGNIHVLARKFRSR